jgi:hypothetical protein
VNPPISPLLMKAGSRKKPLWHIFFRINEIRKTSEVITPFTILLITITQDHKQQQQTFSGNSIATINNSTPYKNNENTHVTRIHCEGVLNNHSPAHTAQVLSRTVPSNYPTSTSVPLFPSTQAVPNTSPCFHARLIEDPNTDSYWPIPATIMRLLVGQ